MRLLVVAFMLAAMPLQGCGDAREGSPCDPSADGLRCDGKQVMVCTCTLPTPNALVVCEGYTWTKGTVCEVACDPKKSPSWGCIASTTPVPECDGVWATCWNGDRYTCENGYPVWSLPCETQAQGTQCTLVPDCQWPLCLPPSPAFDARCPQTGSSSVCIEDTAYFCACGYLYETQECGPGNCYQGTSTGPNLVEIPYASCGPLVVP
jgi:hypothetical protein